MIIENYATALPEKGSCPLDNFSHDRIRVPNGTAGQTFWHPNEDRELRRSSIRNRELTELITRRVSIWGMIIIQGIEIYL